MSISDRFTITCPTCRADVGVSRAHIGKKGRCPQCKTVFPIAEPEGPGQLDLEPLPRSPAALQPWPATPQPLPPASLSSLGSLPNPYGSTYAAPPQPLSPLASDDFRLAPMQTETALPSKPAFQESWQQPGTQLPVENANEGLKTLLGGLAAMAVAVIWFCSALIFFDVLYFYPPVLFVIGLFMFVQGTVKAVSRR